MFGVPKIEGLSYIPDFLTKELQVNYLGQIDALPWMDTLARRVQHYGYRYDYQARAVDESMCLGPYLSCLHRF